MNTRQNERAGKRSSVTLRQSLTTNNPADFVDFTTSETPPYMQCHFLANGVKASANQRMSVSFAEHRRSQIQRRTSMGYQRLVKKESKDKSPAVAGEDKSRVPSSTKSNEPFLGKTSTKSSPSNRSHESVSLKKGHSPRAGSSEKPIFGKCRSGSVSILKRSSSGKRMVSSESGVSRMITSTSDCAEVVTSILLYFFLNKHICIQNACNRLFHNLR